MIVVFKKLLAFFILIFGCVPTVFADTGTPSSVSSVLWKQWTDEAFAKAVSEHKPVLLNLEAVWCHWCHVMEQETYSKPDIAAYINEHFVPMKVDQDSRPDLSNRYQDYGWPATIFFNSSGKEFAKRAGFIEPEEMRTVLKNTVEHPDSVEEAGQESNTGALSSRTALPSELRTKLTDKHYNSYDTENGGLKTSHKFLDADAIEYSLHLASQKSVRDKDMILKTMTENLKLVDPVWGGVYQYSTHGDWLHPHYEKIMSSQAKNIRLYSVSAARFDRSDFSQAAQRTVNYLMQFLSSPDGAFYVSQDADVVRGQKGTDYFSLSDVERRKRGIPVVDTHIYARENGWAINALLQFVSFAANSDSEFDGIVETSVRAAKWIQAHRALGQSGGFSHSDLDTSGPFLGDTLSMGIAFLSLYNVTAEGQYLEYAEKALNYIPTQFLEPTNKSEQILSRDVSEAVPGFLTASYKPGTALSVVRQLDENIAFARFANLMSHYTGKAQYKNLAEHAMKYLATDAVALMYITNAGVLIVDHELNTAPLHMTIVGPKSDLQAKKLFRAALRYPETYRRIEWLDRAEGPLPNSDVQYPELPKPSAFVCTDKRCSLPIYKPEDIAKTLERFAK